MSFILDALRKSESERQREASPSLSHAPLASVRPASPVWTWPVIGILLLALIALSFAWWRSSQPGTDAPATAFAPAEHRDEPAPEPASEPRDADSRAPVATAADTEIVAAPPVPRDPRPIAELHTLDPALPDFKLEFVAFSPGDPAASSAWINGRRYRPGERVENGPEVAEVRADSVILAHRGETFLLELR